MNLLETLKTCLKNNGKSLSDIQWIGCIDFEIQKDEFYELALKTADNFLSEIATDLIIVGKDFWIERSYAETKKDNWIFKQYPEKPKTIQRIKTLDLKTLNEAEYNQILLENGNKSPIIIEPKLWMLRHKK